MSVEKQVFFTFLQISQDLNKQKNLTDPFVDIGK